MRFKTMPDFPLNAGRLFFFSVALAWFSMLLFELATTTHFYPDYGDLFRWIPQFVLPLAESEDPNVIEALFSEYEFPGHAHVLTKSALLAVSQYANFDFHVFRVVGLLSYFSLFGLLMFVASKEMQASDGVVNWWALALILMLLARPDDISLWNNLLTFEYIFFLLSWLMVVSVLRCLAYDGARLSLLVLISASAAMLADITFALALAASYALIILAVFSRSVSLIRAALIAAIPLMVPALLSVWIGLDGDGKKVHTSGDWSDLFQWVSAGLGTGVVSERYLGIFGMSRGSYYTVSVFTGAAVLMGIAFTAFDQLRKRRPPNLAIAMIAFGLLSILGTFLTRGSGGDFQVLAPRYSRYSTFAVAGLAWYWLVVHNQWLKTLARLWSGRAMLAVTMMCLIAVFSHQMYDYRRAIGVFERTHESRAIAMEQFAYGEVSELPPSLLPVLSAWFRTHPERARSMTKWYFDCRKTPEVCKVR